MASRIGAGLCVGVVLAVAGVTGLLREAWLHIITPSYYVTPHPIALFSAHLLQTAALAWLLLRAYRYDNYGVVAATWVLATWEAISSVLRRDLLLSKRIYAEVYDASAFVHILVSTAVFMAVAVHASRDHRRRQEEARWESQRRPYSGARSSSSALPK